MDDSTFEVLFLDFVQEGLVRVIRIFTEHIDSSPELLNCLHDCKHTDFAVYFLFALDKVLFLLVPEVIKLGLNGPTDHFTEHMPPVFELSTILGFHSEPKALVIEALIVDAMPVQVNRFWLLLIIQRPDVLSCDLLLVEEVSNSLETNHNQGGQSSKGRQ